MKLHNMFWVNPLIVGFEFITSLLTSSFEPTWHAIFKFLCDLPSVSLIMSYNVYYSPGWKKFLMYRKMNCSIKRMNIYFIFLGQLRLTWMRFNFLFGSTRFFFFSFLIHGIFRWLIVDVGCNWWSSAIVFFQCFFCSI